MQRLSVKDGTAPGRAERPRADPTALSLYPRVTGRSGNAGGSVLVDAVARRGSGVLPVARQPTAAAADRPGSVPLMPEVLKLNRFFDRQASHAQPSFWHSRTTP